MNKIYFDNAATTFPKPDSVIKAMFDYMSFEGGSANRGSSSTALQSSRAVYECRYEIAKFFLITFQDLLTLHSMTGMLF